MTVALVVMLAACEREQRDFRESPPSAGPAAIVRMSALRPGVVGDTTAGQLFDSAGVAAAHPVDGDAGGIGRYDRNAYAVSEGQRLFGWYNCVGCHSHGGGGMGPALMDDRWIYGSAPENIYATIVEGRPNGMPSFGDRIPPQQLWQLVAYVRSLGALTPSGTRAARSDAMMIYPGSQALREPERPRRSTLPPAAVRP